MQLRRSGSPGVRWLTTPVASTRFHAPYCWPARAGKPSNVRPHRPDRIEIRTGLCIQFFVGRSNGGASVADAADRGYGATELSRKSSLSLNWSCALMREVNHHRDENSTTDITPRVLYRRSYNPGLFSKGRTMQIKRTVGFWSFTVASCFVACAVALAGPGAVDFQVIHNIGGPALPDAAALAINDRDALISYVNSRSSSLPPNPNTDASPPNSRVAPDIDFSKYTLLIFSRGPSTGHSIFIADVREFDTEIRVGVLDMTPGSGCAITQMITYPVVSGASTAYGEADSISNVAGGVGTGIPKNSSLLRRVVDDFLTRD